ncbi:MAG: MFS transporter [Alphaproteobacteria bacterium]|nr:MFS transporter [Alphaproteobacteria bacterium]
MSAGGMRIFYVLVATQALSALGSQVSSFAIGIWVYSKTGEATPLALVSFFVMVPLLLASGFAGVMADRWDRRLIILLADAGAAAGTLVLFVSFATGAFELWHLYAVTIVQAIFYAFQGPAFQASVTLLVDDQNRERANALQLISGPAAGIVGPPVAGLLYGAVGVTGAIVVDLATFAMAATVLLLVRLPRPPRSADSHALTGGLFSQFFAGFRYLAARRSLLGLVAYFSVINFLLASSIVLFSPYLLARLGDAALMGAVYGAFNVGAVAGALLMMVWGGTRPRIHTIMIGILLEGLVLALCGAAQNAWSLSAALFLLGSMFPAVNAAFLSIFQAKVAPDVQGRVFAALGQVSGLLQPLAFLAAGPLADRVFEAGRSTEGWQAVAGLVGSAPGAGMGLMLVICGLLTTAVSIAVYALPAIRTMEARLPDAAPAASPAQ